MNTRTARGAARQRRASLLDFTLAHLPTPTREAHAAGNGLDAGAPNPVFDDAARRRALIERAAYFRAVHRGLEPGHELEDWCEAEREIDTRLFRGEIPAI